MQQLETPKEGVKASIVIVLGYLPVGFAAGIVGVGAGLSPAEVALLSLLVYAGSGQFVFANLLHTSPLSLITTIFLINFRHFLYSAALSRNIKNIPLAKRVAIGSQLTDETFSIMSIFQPPAAAGGLLALNMTSYTAWFVGNVVGALTGVQTAATEWGADFLLIAMFAGLLMLNIIGKQGAKHRLMIAIVSGALMCGLEYITSNALNIILVAGATAALGAMTSRRGRQ